jgi:hypothetical protein
MSLTIELEANTYNAVYNPIVYEFSSDVAADYTIGGEIESETTSNYNGYIQIFNSSAGHGLLVGDYIKISQDGGLAGLAGIWIVTTIINSETFVINAPYTTAPSSPVWYFKYLNNYNAIIRVYGYFECITNYRLIAKIQLKPYFNNGYCWFYIDISDILKDFNSTCNTTEGMTSNLFPLVSPPTIQNNFNSFIKYYISYAEGFDNPVGNEAEYIETGASDL